MRIRRCLPAGPGEHWWSNGPAHHPDHYTGVTSVSARLEAEVLGGQRLICVASAVKPQTSWSWHLDQLIDELVCRSAPTLVGVHGVGTHTAAIFVVAAGDNPHRLHSEAAFAHRCGVAPLPALQ
jgi:transposase